MQDKKEAPCVCTAFPEYQAEAVQHLHFANNAVRIGVLGSYLKLTPERMMHWISGA